jgi:methionyl-tRNA synthetase
LGNLLNRTIGMARKYCQGTVPNLASEKIAADNQLKKIGLELGEKTAIAYESLAFSQVCEAILTLVKTGNKYIDEQAPWTLYKQGQQQAVEEVLYTILESVRLAAYLLSPIIPTISSAIYQQLGFSTDFDNKNLSGVPGTFAIHSTWGILPGGQKLADPRPVFQRLELPEVVSS